MPPVKESDFWQSPIQDSPIEPSTVEKEFICSDFAMTALDPDENVCIGLELHRERTATYVAYEDVGEGNSHSYVRELDRSKDRWTLWKNMGDKEFLFTATADVDCDATTTTTSTMTTTTSSTTTTMPMDDDDDSVDDDLTDDDSSDDDTATEDDAATSDDDDDDNDDGGGICGS
ncbi:MAG: hypothetical protein H6684_14720 [Deltaproteobacteria bacterium]|nr:hypothetical protein [Deltaproteobacteria bacterium]